ncbi:Hypothetical protein I596_2400 [Dokdonella koreensis DS-123]|uniref:Uncharacterized protein n=1 Tax=Dokdonella koreensis DS-123 TaxID=1300342 RepID=A0A160DV59_9GAMM|nr:Hypothetical protein I596_2400 [Dokdonella koreensis DS-123]
MSAGRPWDSRTSRAARSPLRARAVSSLGRRSTPACMD